MMSARIEGPKRRGLVVRVLHFFVRRKLGKVPTPMQVQAHQPKLLMAVARMELALMRTRRVPASLKSLAQIRTGTLVGCPF